MNEREKDFKESFRLNAGFIIEGQVGALQSLVEEMSKDTRLNIRYVKVTALPLRVTEMVGTKTLAESISEQEANKPKNGPTKSA